MKMVYLIYFNLSPGRTNQYNDISHEILLEKLNENFSKWTDFSERKMNYRLGFAVVTKQENKELCIYGPTVFRKKRDIEFSLFLPKRIEDLNEYVDLVFEGIRYALKGYKIFEPEFSLLRREVKILLGLNVPLAHTVPSF